MALDSGEMKAKFQSRIQAGLSRVFSAATSKGSGYPPIAQEAWAELADAISDIAIDVVNEIQTKADVVPGQQVVGTFTGVGSGPVTAVTISTGKIT